jgi:hypothetical protein
MPDMRKVGTQLLALVRQRRHNTRKNAAAHEVTLTRYQKADGVLLHCFGGIDTGSSCTIEAMRYNPQFFSFHSDRRL